MSELSIPHSNLREKAYERLKALIVNETFPPGSRINVEKLTRDFGVSRTPIWEAVQKLIQDGLLENIPRRGVFVLNLSLDRVEEIYSLWEVLESFVARRATERRNSAAISRIHRSLQQQAKCLERHDLAGYAEAVGDFHRRIAEAAGHKQAEGFLASLIGQSQALGFRSIYFPGRPAKDLEEHTAIFHAIESGDGERAEALTRTHLGMVKEKVLESFASDRQGLESLQRQSSSA